MSMTIQSSVKDKILDTSSETSKVENTPAEMLRDLDQQMEKRADDDAAESVSDAIRFEYCLASSSGWTKSPVLWAEIGESSLIGPELVQETTDKVVLIKEKLKAARDRQKSCADNRRKPLEFEVGERVMLKVSPWKGVIRFRKKGKLAPRYVGPFEILERISPVAYQLRLPEELSGIKVDKTLRFVEEPVKNSDCEVMRLKCSRMVIVKVRFWLETRSLKLQSGYAAMRTLLWASKVVSSPNFLVCKQIRIGTVLKFDFLRSTCALALGNHEVDKRVFPIVVDWLTNAPKDGMTPANSYSMVDVTTLNTRRTPIQKQLEALLCLIGLSRNYLLGDDDTPNPSKVRTETRPRATHEVPLLTSTANRIIEMEDTVVVSGSLGTSAAIEKSPLDFVDENPPPVITERGDIATTEVIPEASLEKEVTAMGPVVNKRCSKRENEGTEANAPPKVLRKDHVASHLSQSTLGGKSLAAIEIETGSAVPATTTQETLVSDSDLLSSKKVPVAEDPDSKKSTSFTSIVGSPGSIYQSGWGVTNNCHLDTPAVCQDVVDHIVPPGYFLELRYLPQDDFLSRYNINMAQQVAMGSQLRLRYKQEAKLLKKSIAQVARRDQRIEAREKHIKNLEALLEVEADMKKAAEAKNAQVTGEERIKAAFEEFKKYEDDKLEKRCVEMDARLDALSIDVDEELYPHMLTAITSCRWVIGHGLRLTVMKCAKSLELRQAFANVMSARIAKGSKIPFGRSAGKIEGRPNRLNYGILVLGERYRRRRSIIDPGASPQLFPAHNTCIPGAPTAAPQGLVILLADMDTQTEDEASPRLIRSKSLPLMYHLDCP
ncbi:hypothetical protein Tco_1183553 [Tanacetum coccineum]